MILRNKRIFLVEDDPVNLAVIRVLLTNYGATVAYDHWGDSTLMSMSNYHQSLDLIILDIHLKGVADGYNIFDAIKQISKLENVPIVAVTASDPTIELIKVRQKGFNGYISKPIDRRQFPHDLLTIINGGEVWPS